MMAKFYLKTNRIFNGFRRFSWLLVPLISFGGLYYPKLGLLVLLVMFSIMILGLLKGKFWCGNLCPHGSLFDGVIMPISRFKKIPKFFKSSIVKWSFFVFYMIMFVRRIVKVSGLWGTLKFWDKLGYLFVMQYLVMPTIIGGLLALIINPRSWCSICPMGSMGQVMYKLGKLLNLNKNIDKKVSIDAVEKCHKCGTCARVCPLQLEPYLKFDDNNQFAEENCIKCATCVENCPAEILDLNNLSEAKNLQQTTKLNGYKNRVPIKATIEEINALGNDTREYTFKLKSPQELNYKPGQFILIKVSDKLEIYRAYSISSKNIKDKARLSVTIKMIEGGYGTTIIDNEFKVGDSVELEGPMGNELIIDQKTDKVLLMAGGIGITPFVPIVKDLVEHKDSLENIKLIHGVNQPNDFIYNQYFEKLSLENDKFEYIKTVVSPDEDWSGHKGFVTDVLKELDIIGYKAYLCGPKPMIDATLITLAELEERDRGIAKEDIYYESA